MWEKDTKFAIPGDVGEIECATMVVAESQRDWAGVICHPDPGGGGTMDNKVVSTVARSMREVGMPSVRFNYRGVGLSGGESTGGSGEAADCLKVIQWLRRQKPNADIVLAGFSFGSYVALRASSECGPLLAMLSIAPSVTMQPFAGLTLPTCPWLIVQGEADELIAPSAVYDWVAGLADNVQFIRMPDTSHYYHGQLVPLKAHIVDFLKEVDSF